MKAGRNHKFCWNQASKQNAPECKIRIQRRFEGKPENCKFEKCSEKCREKRSEKYSSEPEQ